MQQAVDIAVMGGGLAGLCAALHAASLGTRVIVLEKGSSPAYACNSRMAMGYMRIGGLDMEADPALLLQTVRRLTLNQASEVLAERLSRDAGSAIGWLRSQGVSMIRDRAGASHASLLAPPAPRRPGLDWPGRGADRMLRRLEAQLQSMGGRVARGSGVTAIEPAGDGFRIEVEDASGRKQAIHPAAIVICDGGFQGDPERVRRYISPAPESLLARHAGTGCGDGIRLAEALGAGMTGMDMFYGHVQSRDALDRPELWPYPAADLPILGGIAVDRTARRFADEGLGGIAMANAIARLDDPLQAVAIFDARVWEGLARNFIIPANPLLVTAGATVHCATDLASLAAAAGLPKKALAETVAQFNAAAVQGHFEGLQHARTTHLHRPDPIEIGPFFAVPLCAGMTYTMGGIAIDGEARVLRSDGSVIDGLFAAGSATGGHEGGPSAGYTGGLAKALVFGRQAGISAARQARTRGEPSLSSKH